jgi:hypothetical protein
LSQTNPQLAQRMETGLQNQGSSSSNPYAAYNSNDGISLGSSNSSGNIY